VYTVYKIVCLAGLGAVAGGSIELSSNDLTKSGRSLDNIKATWSQSLNVLGNSATVSAEYDRAERKDFVNEASLAGKIAKVKYELTTRFGGATGLTLETTTDDGTTVEAEGSMQTMSSLPKISKVSASRAATLRGTDCNLEISHEVDSNESKLKLSTLLGSGVKAIGTLASKGGSHDTTYEIEYDTTLTEGRTLSANVNPKDGSGEIEFVDTATLDGELTATIPLGGEPKLTLKRAFNF
jgi:hypothetical protein